MLSFILFAAALAAPPSSSLSGESGALTWNVQSSGDELVIQGSAPTWTVSHTARSDFSPIRTTRTGADGATTTVDYRPDGATVVLGGKTIEVRDDSLWDGDTLDIRLGQLITEDRVEQRFSVIDSGSGKVYGFDSQRVKQDQCGAESCTHVLVQLTGLLRWVGPSFNYWFAADGRLLKFEGPAGTFTASGV